LSFISSADKPAKCPKATQIAYNKQRTTNNQQHATQPNNNQRITNNKQNKQPKQQANIKTISKQLANKPNNKQRRTNNKHSTNKQVTYLDIGASLLRHLHLLVQSHGGAVPIDRRGLGHGARRARRWLPDDIADLVALGGWVGALALWRHCCSQPVSVYLQLEQSALQRLAAIISNTSCNLLPLLVCPPARHNKKKREAQTRGCTTHQRFEGERQ
jgi:hypothetical protein